MYGWLHHQANESMVKVSMQFEPISQTQVAMPNTFHLNDLTFFVLDRFDEMVRKRNYFGGIGIHKQARQTVFILLSEKK